MKYSTELRSGRGLVGDRSGDSCRRCIGCNFAAVLFYRREAPIRRGGESIVNASVGIDILHADTFHHLPGGNCQSADPRPGGIGGRGAIGQVLTTGWESNHLVGAGGHLKFEARDRASAGYFLNIPMLAADEI